LVASQPTDDPDQNVKKSRFDFNADGYADSLLEVRFFADKFPSEVGFGDPYVEPNLAGTVSGYILDESNNTIDDFGLWFFEAPDGLDGFWEPAFFEVDINHSNGHFTANLPEGNFYAEAWGYDNVNGVPYKPQTSESIFSISSGSNLDYNFSLEKEYVPDGGYGDITASLIVVEQEVGDHFDVSIELFPVDDSNQSLSEWSAAWLWVGPNGEISGSAPAGRFKVVLNSYDNSIRLNGGPIYWDIVADQLNNMGTLNASKSLPVRVSGMITDADTGDGIWAEVVFVDPNDEQRIFWPVWDNFNLGGDLNGSGNEENEVLFASGVYSVRIPAGSYKIKAVDWSGFYAEEYYQEGTAGTSDFTTASEVNVTNDLADINFTLSSGSVAEIRVNVTDDNTSTALPYAWFDFFDAYDEYAPITFPRVNYTDDGNYSLKISAGSYKLLIGSPDHRSLFLHTDVEGNYTWKEGDWSSAATLDVSSDQTVFLPNAELERWAIILPPPPPGDNSISGKVLSSKGVAVPKASIQCYTDDWMFWFEATSRSDGSFEFTNLPSGNWILEAHPPYDSAEFTGLQPALPNWENPIQLGVGETKDYNLILEGSNVSGRILYPKKDENHRVRLKPLPYA